MEQPMYATILEDYQLLKKNFDLLATYSQETTYPGSGVPNLPLTYYPLHVYDANAVKSLPKTFAEKDGYGTGMCSNSFLPNVISLPLTLRGACGHIYI
jgi:hypothetical protein